MLLKRAIVLTVVFVAFVEFSHAESSSSSSGGRLEALRTGTAVRPKSVSPATTATSTTEEYGLEDGENNNNSGEFEEYEDGEEGEDEEEVAEGEDSQERSDLEKEDIIDTVTTLEQDAEEQEKMELFPEVLGVMAGNSDAWNHTDSRSVFYSSGQFRENDTSLPEDLTELPENIEEDVEAGVDEFLMLSSDEKFRNEKVNGTAKRQFPIYMFQGQYIPEPRLNRFIDGAVRNFGTEVRIAIMDPLFFRVLPKGRVEHRNKPFGNQMKRDTLVRSLEVEEEPEADVAEERKVSLKVFKRPAGNNAGGVKRRRVNNRNRNKNRNKNGFKNGNKNRRRVQANNKKRRPNQGNRRKIVTRRKPGKVGQRRRPGNRRNPNRRKNNNNNKNKNKNRNKNNNKNRFNKNRVNKNRRQKRRAKRNVGGGRVEGLSHVTRDGDAEMQVFGNYTLIRSHMKVGPVELSMQFRTRKGLRRTGATIPFIRMHAVARVNNEGSEMVDFLLDRPHPESIKVRGKLFPLAQRMARNIFSRLFMPSSFLASRLREKASLALLSKPRRR